MDEPEKRDQNVHSRSATRDLTMKSEVPFSSSNGLATHPPTAPAPISAPPPSSPSPSSAQLHAATRARLKSEQAETRQHERDLLRRIESQGPKIVDDVETPEEQATRLAMAAAAKAQREMMDKERRHQNAELQRKLKQVKPATVDEYDSAAVEAYRAKLAAEARQRQEREVAERKKWSSYLKQRIAAATDEDGNDEEKERFRKLVGSHELKRPSPMPESELRIFRSYVKAKELGDSIRKQKEEWRTQRAESESAHVSRGQKRWQKKREQQRAVQKLHSELLQERLDNGAQLKAEQERGQMRLEKELSKAAKETRRRYHEARGHDSRLDSLEEAQAAHKREEASQMRSEMERSLKEVRESELAARREQASVVRQIKTALAATRQQLAEQQAQRGQIGREEFESGRALREITEVQHLEGALSNKARSAAIRASIRAKSKAVLRRKMKQAEEVRQKIAESLNSGTAYDGMMAKKQQVRESYEHRYGTEHEAAEWQTSALQKLQAWSRWAINGLGQSLPKWNAAAKVSTRHSVAQDPVAPPDVPAN